MSGRVALPLRLLVATGAAALSLNFMRLSLPPMGEEILGIIGLGLSLAVLGFLAASLAPGIVFGPVVLGGLFVLTALHTWVRVARQYASPLFGSQFWANLLLCAFFVSAIWLANWLSLWLRRVLSHHAKAI